MADIDKYFSKTVEGHGQPRPCSSIKLMGKLRKEAVVKKGSEHDKNDKNLLFPPKHIWEFLSKEKVLSVFCCKCAFCSAVPGGVDSVGLSNLAETLAGKAANGEHDRTKRRLFCVLLFMGAGFLARHLCKIHTEGTDITPQKNILEGLLTPLKTCGLFRDADGESRDIASHFMDIFGEARKIFEAPKFKSGDDETFMQNENLPFLKDAPLLDRSDKSSRLFAFEIHPEYHGQDVPRSLVRKEADLNSVNGDEKIALQLLAQSEELRKVHLIKLVFSYIYGDQFNYVFKQYRGSLQDIFDDKLKLQNHVKPQGYRGSKLQHRLWQGAVDLVKALASFHAQSSFHNSVHGEHAAAHFDVKPANILVDEDGSLILADFGEAQIVSKGERFSTQGGDYNYRPPRKDPKSGWSQAYDVWSMACVLTEIIEYIISIKNKNKSDRVTKFRTARISDNPSNAAFWIVDTGRYKLRPSVKKVLEGFRSPEDEYLNVVADLLDTMFEVEESKRPNMAKCFDILSQNVTPNAFPQPYEGEISIMCSLRNKPTHFEHRIEQDENRQMCKMHLYMPLAECEKGERMVRLLIEFDETLDGILLARCKSESVAQYEKEELRLLSLFSRDWPHGFDAKHLCEFKLIHRSRRFVFDKPHDYYGFLAAATHQELVLRTKGGKEPYVNIPINRCTVKPSGFHWGDNRIVYNRGYIQLWKELSEEEYGRRFISPPAASSSGLKARPSASSNTLYSTTEIRPPMRVATSQTARSSSSAVTTASRPWTLPRRVVIFFPNSPQCFLTFDVANGQKKLQERRDSEEHVSQRHLTIRKDSDKGDFCIGKFESDRGCPGFPLDPNVLKDKENFKVTWVEIEFTDKAGHDNFNALSTQLGFII